MTFQITFVGVAYLTLIGVALASEPIRFGEGNSGYVPLDYSPYAGVPEEERLGDQRIPDGSPLDQARVGNSPYIDQGLRRDPGLPGRKQGGSFPGFGFPGIGLFDFPF